MSRFFQGHFCRVAAFGVALLTCSVACNSASAQFFNNGFNRIGVVGGVKIDANGLARQASITEQKEMLELMRQGIKGATQDFQEPSNLRMISLKGIQKLIAESVQSGTQLPEEVSVLGGLTAIHHVFVYPESNDIVLAGPAEPWKVGDSGAVVGTITGKPVLYLDDLLCAFQTTTQARDEGISCSIEPTAEGMARLNRLLSSIRLGPNTNPSQFEPQMREAFGPQLVRLTGLPGNSHMANVLLAADYQMKRYGMNLEQAPVKGMPSYVDMIRKRNLNGVPQSRWWMECDYAKIERTQDRLSWKLDGKIRATSDVSTVTDQGLVSSGQQDKYAEKWAETFTSKMDELMVANPVFGELRNVMDLAVVAAIVESQKLGELANCDLSVLSGKTDSVELAAFEIPKNLPPQCSFLRTGNGWITTTSGGVLVDSWYIASNNVINEQVAASRPEVADENTAWCWN